MITNDFLIANGFEYKSFKDGNFWFIKIYPEEEYYGCDCEIYQVSEDRSVIQYYDGLDTYNLSESSFIDAVIKIKNNP